MHGLDQQLLGASIDLGWVQLVALASVRIAAFLVIAPPFSHAAIPMQVKGMLAIGLGLAMSARLDAASVPPDAGGFALALVLEVVHGAFLGFLVMVVYSALQSAGGLIDLFGGFQLAQGFDPGMNINGAQFTRLLHLVAVVLLVTTDGYQLVLGGLGRSFDSMPIGTAFDAAGGLDALVTTATQSFLAAVQIAGPLLVVLVLADVGLGLLTRVSPALQAFQLGYPLKIVLTLAFAGVVLLAVPRVVSALTGNAVDLLLGVH